MRIYAGYFNTRIYGDSPYITDWGAGKTTGTTADVYDSGGKSDFKYGNIDTDRGGWTGQTSEPTNSSSGNTGEAETKPLSIAVIYWRRFQ